ncbi:MAG TPA: MASE1 domain-containing protein, partial [Nocardioides sp.]|nr:MASE1 domain-containing protein [Nocardioides sp.]
MTVGTTPSTGTSARPRPGLGVAFAFLAAGLVLGFMGRATVIEGTDLAAVWPAAGVGVVWLLVRQAGPLSLDTALLGGAMVTSALVSGFPLWLSLSLPTTHLLQTVIIVELMRRALPELWGCGGTQAIDTPRRLARYLGCVGAGVVVSTFVAMSWWRLAGEEADGSLALVWFGRNACGVLVVATALLLFMQYLDQSPPRRRQWAGSWLEFAAACATSAALYGLVFVGDVHSMLFLLLGVVIWFGV